MQRSIRRLAAALLSAVLVLILAPAPAGAFQGDAGTQATILFTHDMHSHFLPVDDGQGDIYGGYARLSAAIGAQRALHPDALLVDGGDFSMGSLFQAAYATSALELRAMGRMGYDAVTFGNHEYDYRPAGLASMLNAAVDSGEALPALVEANYLPPAQGEQGYDGDSQAVWDAFERYGVTGWVHVERGGVHYAIFGINGVDSDACAPISGMVLSDPAGAAQRVVDEARAACLRDYGVQPLVVCLSHSGTDGEGKGEDYELAQKVDGIDLIVSGHTHTLLEQPIQVGGTYIVSCGEYTKKLGSVTLDYTPGQGVTLVDYSLIPIDGSLPEDADMAAWIEQAKGEVERTYLSRFGLGFDQVLTDNPYPFESAQATYDSHHDSPLGSLFADAYAWAVERAEGEGVDIALTASGVIRESVPRGDVTVSDVFNTTSLGIGADGVPGYPLVTAYLTGKDLKTALEIDASVSDLMPAARLYFSGVEYEFNTRRMLFNRVTRCGIRTPDGELVPIEDGKLYKGAVGLYCIQMMGAVKDVSRGLISITPRTADGTPMDLSRLDDYIVHDSSGGEVKEWAAIAGYLQAMGGTMDERYAAPDGRKVVYASLNPVELLKNPNVFTLALLGAALALLLAVALTVCLIARRRRRRGGKHAARGYSPYRGRR